MNPGIVLVTYQCREYVLKCLETVALHLPGSLPLTAVVDNASDDGTVEAVRAAYPQVRVVANTANRGFAPAVNQGIDALSDCRVVALLNPDAELLDGGLASASDYLEANADVGLVGVRIENSDGSLQPSCRQFPGHLTAIFNKHSLITKLVPANRWSQAYLMTDWPHDEVRDVDWVAFSCALIHRRSFEAVGKLDEGYFWSIEDVDYGRSLHDAGLRVVYFPMARVRHRVGGSSRKNVYPAMLAHHRGMWRYYKKHGHRNLALDVATAAGIGLRFAIHAVSYLARTGFRKVRGRPEA